MRSQKIVATIMLLMSSTLMIATSHGDIAYPTVLGILGLLGLQRRLTWDIKPNQRIIRSWLLLGLAILLAAHYHYSPPAWRGQEQAIALAWQTVSQYFLAAMVLTLFLGSPTELPASLGLFHIAITICAGQILLLDDLLVLFRLLEILSVILVVLYTASAAGIGRRPAPAWLGAPDSGKDRGFEAVPQPVTRQPSSRYVAVMILIIAANLGWIIGSTLYQHVEIINYLPLWLARQGRMLEQVSNAPATVGFTTSGRLSSMIDVLQGEDSTPALTIDSRNSPGYLRARAFNTYRSSEWRNWPPTETLYATGSNPVNLYVGGRTNTFRLTEGDYSDLDYMTIRYESEFQNATFMPPGAVTMETALPALQRDEDGIVYAPGGIAAGKSYRVGYTLRAFRSEPVGTELHRMKVLSSQLDPNITQLARRIFAGRTTTAEKIDAVIDHFRKHYTYSLSMDIPEGQDKLTYFLLSGTSGYCEYFASGAAILLRVAGVPTRYVTGFFVTQRGERSGSWVARNMDAHAWAEAWDDERKCWTIVEATVQGGANTTPVAPETGQAEAGLTARLRQLAQAVYQYGLLGLIGWLFTSYGIFVGSLALSIALCGMLWWAFVRLRRRRGEAALGPYWMQLSTVVAMHRMLARMDRKVRRLGLRRRPAETLLAFATRIASLDNENVESKHGSNDVGPMADWYVQYAGLRYARSVSPDQLQRLRLSAQAVQNKKIHR